MGPLKRLLLVKFCMSVSVCNAGNAALSGPFG